jgi:hypothetical protein
MGVSLLHRSAFAVRWREVGVHRAGPERGMEKK